MKILAALLNLPWSALGLMQAVISIPKQFWYQDGALAFRVRSFWWAGLAWWLKGLRGTAAGNVIVLLASKEEPRDLEHELVHIEQHNRYPLIFPILHTIETIRFGYQGNRFEREAYGRAGNIYHAK